MNFFGDLNVDRSRSGSETESESSIEQYSFESHFTWIINVQV